MIMRAELGGQPRLLFQNCHNWNNINIIIIIERFGHIGTPQINKLLKVIKNQIDKTLEILSYVICIQATPLKYNNRRGFMLLLLHPSRPITTFIDTFLIFLVPVESKRPQRAQKNVFTRMESMKGPLARLTTYVDEKTRIKVRYTV